VQLKITVLEGEGALNNTGQRSSHEPVVRVEDEAGRVLPKAAVVFTLPTNGASGEFGNGSKTLTVMTDEQGRAAGRGLKANRVAGKLLIHVNASYRGQSARTMITQFNMDVPGGSGRGGSGKIVAIIALIGAAAAGGAFAATRKGNTSTASPSTPATPSVITITPDPGVIGPPR
jgi:hypothetical protein